MQIPPPLLCVGDGDEVVGTDEGADDEGAAVGADEGAEDGWVVTFVVPVEDFVLVDDAEDAVDCNAWRGV